MPTLLKLIVVTLCVAAGYVDAQQTGSTASRLDHVAISVSNAKASAAFYRGAFGFAELKTPFGDGADVVWLDLGGGIALHVFGGRTTRVLNEHERHLAFAVADMSKVTGFLASRGIPWQNFEGVRGEMQKRPDGVHSSSSSTLMATGSR